MNKKIFLLFSVLFLFLTLSSHVYGSDLVDKEKEISELETKVNGLRNQSKTLADQVVYYDNQIKLTSLKISQTETLVNTISEKINTLEGKLQERANVLEKQIVQTYKQKDISPLTFFLSSNSVTEAISKSKYLQIIQANSRRLLYDTQKVQTSYSEQKKLMEQAGVRLASQKKNLDALKIEKDNLLTQTKNDEKVYAKQLEQALLELESIKQALIAGKIEGPVKKGDPIALMGNSGYPSCSSGAHLHFEVRINDQWVNSENYVVNRTDKWGLNIGSGKWDWPMNGDIEITQRYGKTPYSYRYKYSGGIHTGIDMVSSDRVIYAPADGTLYSYIGKCGSSELKMKYIDHGSGLKSLYLHVQ